LAQDSGVTDLVSNRVYPLTIPIDASLPAVAYQKITDLDQLAHDGPTGSKMARIQITITADTYNEIKDIEAAIVAALSGYNVAAMADESYKINVIIIENVRDGYNQTVKTKTVRMDTVSYYETG
jgi:hypothetical protein